MASFEIVRTKSIKSTSDLRTKQYTFVKLDGSGQIDTPGSGGWCIGVLQDKPNVGDPGAVCYPGDITKVLCGGTFAAGADVMTDGSGQAVAVTTGGFILGQALNAGASAKYAEIVYQPKASKGV